MDLRSLRSRSLEAEREDGLRSPVSPEGSWTETDLALGFWWSEASASSALSFLPMALIFLNMMLVCLFVCASEAKRVVCECVCGGTVAVYL